MSEDRDVKPRTSPPYKNVRLPLPLLASFLSTVSIASPDNDDDAHEAVGVLDPLVAIFGKSLVSSRELRPYLLGGIIWWTSELPPRCTVRT